MNPDFLNTYARHHLSDIGEFSEEAISRFTSECSDFLSTIKSVDRDLWEEVMTMSSSKKSLLMKHILEDSASIIPKTNDQRMKDLEDQFEDLFGTNINDPLTESEIVDACDDFKITRSEYDNIVEAEQSQIEEGFITASYKKLGGLSSIVRMFNSLTGINKLKGIDDLMSDNKTKKISNILKFIASIMFMFKATVAVGFLMTTLWSVVLIVMLLFIIMGTNWVSTIMDIGRTMAFGIYKIMTVRFGDKKVSSIYSAMYALEKTQLQGCLSSCDINQNISRREQLHIVKLSVSDRSKRDSKPEVTGLDSRRYVKADCLFNCSMRFMISMIAELFGALKACIKNTMGVELKIRGDAIDEIQSMTLDAVCEPIRRELNDIIQSFNGFIRLAFKSDHQESNQWRQAMNAQIRRVMNGQHSRPVSVKYGEITSITPIVFEF